MGFKQPEGDNEFDKYRKEENEKFVNYLFTNLISSSDEIRDLQARIKRKDALLTYMNMGQYLIGLCMLIAPLILYLSSGGTVSLETNVIVGGLGFAELLVLMVTDPIKKTHKYMGDFTQISIALTGFVEQVACILIATDMRDEFKTESFLEATKQIGDAKRETMTLVQKYYEEKPLLEKSNDIPKNQDEY